MADIIEQKIILPNDTMSQYVALKEKLKNDPNARLRILECGHEFVQAFIAYNDEKIRYYYAIYRIYFSRNMMPYLKAVKSMSFSFCRKTRKITTINLCLQNISDKIIDIINNLLKVEWFSNINKCKNYEHIPRSLFYGKLMLSLIWGKKITNPEDLIKNYSSRVLQLKNITWTRVRNFFNERRYFFFKENRNLILIDKWVENPNLFIDKILAFDKSDFTHLDEYRDYLHQIAALQIQSNVAKWSINRMLNEHNKLSTVLMGVEIDNKDNKPIFSDEYNSYLPKDIRCRFINTEKLCFFEGSSMNNCIYTNYWLLISTLRYYAISIDDKKYGRATLGISHRRSLNGELIFEVDQIRGIRNGPCNEELVQIMNQWVQANQKLFKQIQENNLNKNLELSEKNSTFVTRNELVNAMPF